jgi:Fic family protein
VFDYASPEETPALMSDLISWYNEEERKGILSPVELAALFHYRYIRIHPFEDGNGRIARLLVNYILLRHNYPMIVIRTDDRANYLKILHQCDLLTGKMPFDGAYATFEQAKPLIDYIVAVAEKKLIVAMQLAKGEITEIIESTEDKIPIESGQKGGQKKWSEKVEFPEGDVADDDLEKMSDNQRQTDKEHSNVPENVPENVPDSVVENVVENMAAKRQKAIVKFIRMNNQISATEIADLLKVNPKTVKRDFQQLKKDGLIKRVGSERGGHWEVIK